MILVAQGASQHIADIQSFDIRSGRVVHSRLDGIPGQMADGGIPMLTDLRLSYSND
jgi:hypothetical protein